jgi:hypothetical protein
MLHLIMLTMKIVNHKAISLVTSHFTKLCFLFREYDQAASSVVEIHADTLGIRDIRVRLALSLCFYEKNCKIER